MNAAPLSTWLAARQRWLVVIGCCVLAGVATQYTFKVVRDPSRTRSAILRWTYPLQHVTDGTTDIYHDHNFPCPPVMALLLHPLSLLNPIATALSWFWLKVVMTVVAFFWVFRMVADLDKPFPIWAMGVTVLLCLWPIAGDLTHGNVNLFIMFLVVGALFAYQRGWDFSAGVVMALAIAGKVTPAAFLPYFIWKRAWKSVAGLVVGLALFLVVIPGAILGMERNFTLLASWNHLMLEPFVEKGEIAYSEHQNQSLPGAVSRLLAHNPSYTKFVKNLPVPDGYHNLLDLTEPQVKLVVKVSMLLFGLAILWLCRTPTQHRAGWRLPAEFSLIITAMLVFSERTWKHHCVTWVLPCAVLCYYLAVCRPSRRLGIYLAGTLMASGLLVVLASIDTREKGLGDLAQVYGAYLAVNLLLTVALGVLLRQPANQQVSASAGNTPELTRRAESGAASAA